MFEVKTWKWFGSKDMNPALEQDLYPHQLEKDPDLQTLPIFKNESI